MHLCYSIICYYLYLANLLWNVSRLRGTFRKYDCALDGEQWSAGMLLVELCETQIQRAAWITSQQQRIHSIQLLYSLVSKWEWLPPKCSLETLTGGADFGASLIEPSRPVDTSELSGGEGQKHDVRNEPVNLRLVSMPEARSGRLSLCGVDKHESTVVWPVQIQHHRPSATLIHDLYID